MSTGRIPGPLGFSEFSGMLINTRRPLGVAGTTAVPLSSRAPGASMHEDDSHTTAIEPARRAHEVRISTAKKAGSKVLGASGTHASGERTLEEFKVLVKEAQIRHLQKKGRHQFDDVPDAELEIVEGKFRMRRAASKACRELLGEVRSVWIAATAAKDASAVRTAHIGIKSAYRNYAEDGAAWRRSFGLRYEANKGTLAGLPGGVHGDAALTFMTGVIGRGQGATRLEQSQQRDGGRFYHHVQGACLRYHGEPQQPQGVGSGRGCIRGWSATRESSVSNHWRRRSGIGTIDEGVLGVCATSLMACAAASPEAKVAGVSQLPAPTSAVTAASPLPDWPARDDLFIALTSMHVLELRAFGPHGLEPFSHVIASDIQETLYNPELGLFWFLDTNRLWVIDLRSVGAGTIEPILIASNVPEVDTLYIVAAGRSFQAPWPAGDESIDLWLHWDEPPYLQGGKRRDRIDELEGVEWLARERSRPASGAPAWTDFAKQAPLAPLPAARAQCTDEEQCVAALPFGDRGWQLVLAGDELGDFEHHFCLLYDPARNAFATPPDAKTWGDALTLASAGCGPFFFNARNDAYFDSDVLCHTAGGCVSLDDASAEGRVVPGVGVGAI